MKATAANIDPPVTPTKPGSANGFRKSPCSAAPAVARLAPTNIAINVRGSLICQSKKLTLSGTSAEKTGKNPLQTVIKGS